MDRAERRNGRGGGRNRCGVCGNRYGGRHIKGEAGIRKGDADEDGAVVADAAEVARTGVCAEGFVAGVGGVALRQERRFQDGERRRSGQRR